jgi:putative oxidoreductase
MSQQSTAIQQPPTADAPARPVDSFAARHQDFWLLLGRLALGAIFVTSGLEKVLDLGKFAANLASKGVPQSQLLAPLGACVEFFGGLAVVLGFETRIAALLMLAFTVVATGISHRYWELDGAARVPQEVNFFKNVSILGGFFFLFAVGAGRVSLDALLRGRRRG